MKSHPGTFSNAEDTAADQIRQPLSLFRCQQRMNFLKGAVERFAQPRRALNTAVTRAGGLGGVERFPAYGVRKLGQRSPIIHFGLSSLGLDVVEDPDQRGDLLLVEVELVCEEPQRASDAEGRPALEPIGVVMMMGHETPFALAPIVTGGAPKVLKLLQPIVTRKKGEVFEVTLLASMGMTHGSLLLARALRSRRGNNAWAPRRTLNRTLRRNTGSGQERGVPIDRGMIHRLDYGKFVLTLPRVQKFSTPDPARRIGFCDILAHTQSGGPRSLAFGGEGILI